VPYNKISQHYLEKTHQQLLMKFIKQILPQYSRGNSKSVFQKTVDEEYQRSLTECLVKIHSLIQEIDPIIGNCARLTSERQAIETKINQLRTQFSKEIKEPSENSVKILEIIHQILANMDKLLDEIKSKSITGLILISLDGTHTSKVNVAILITNGQTIQSESFHSCQSGYKMGLSFDIHIDERNQKRYLSISFIIFPGEFDAILSWPFVYPITISVMDLTGTKKHIVQTTSRDGRTVAFNRPVSNKNSSFCVSKFCLLDTLLENGNSYVQDGYLFVQTHVDFAASSANPSSNPNKDTLKIVNDPIQNNILSDMSVN